LACDQKVGGPSAAAGKIQHLAFRQPATASTQEHDRNFMWKILSRGIRSEKYFA
jgi:hypothetical protein